MRSGLPLSETALDVLFYGALAMFNSKTKRKRIQANDCEGELTTEFHSALLGTVGGIQFSAQIDTELGSTTVKYIVQTRDLEGMEDTPWMTHDPSTGAIRPVRETRRQ